MRVIAAIVVACVGCGSSGSGGAGGGTDATPGAGSQAGSISAAVTTTDGGGGTSSFAYIFIANTPGLCADASASPAIDRKGQHFTAIQLADVSGSTSTTPTAPGTYTIYPNSGSQPPKSASLHAGAFDDTCQTVDTADAQGQSGSVTLASISGDAFTGSYDVTLNTGGHLTGMFTPAACPALAQALASAGQHACD